MDHVLYMDDLKIYVGIPRQLNQLINIVELYTSNKNEIWSGQILDI